MLWQYRTNLFEFTKDGLLGDKYVDDEEMEKTLNELGGQEWELVSVSLLQDGLLVFLKRPMLEGAEAAIEQPRIIEPVALPVVESRPADFSRDRCPCCRMGCWSSSSAPCWKAQRPPLSSRGLSSR